MKTLIAILLLALAAPAFADDAPSYVDMQLKYRTQEVFNAMMMDTPDDIMWRTINLTSFSIQELTDKIASLQPQCVAGVVTDTGHKMSRAERKGCYKVVANIFLELKDKWNAKWCVDDGIITDGSCLQYHVDKTSVDIQVEEAKLRALQ